MSAFCTQCGSVLVAGTRYCTQCGSGKAANSRRWLWWLLALILVFALGLWLGRLMAPKCPRCPAVPVAGNGAGAGGGGGGGGGKPGVGAGGPGGGGGGGGGGAAGTGRVLGEGGSVNGGGGAGSAGSGSGEGDVEGGGGANASGTTVGHGYDGNAVGGNGTDDSSTGTGGGKTRLQGDSGDAGPSADANATEAGVWRLAAGGELSASGVDAPLTSAQQASNRVLTAHDFRYDRTQLPRYPDAVRSVASGISYPPGGRTDTYGTSAGIVTASAFDAVVDWYRKNLPPGWHDMTIGDLGGLAQQLSAENIMKMFGSSGGKLTATPASAAAPQTKVSIFRPPAGATNDSAVMIVQKGDQPVVAFLQAHVKS